MQYAAEFAEVLDREQAILERLRMAGVLATQYGQSETFSTDWGGVDFMAVSALKDKMDSYVLHLCSLLPDVVTLSRRVDSELSALDMYMLLEANDFDIDTSAAAAQARGDSASSQNCIGTFDRDPEIQDAIKQAESDILRDVYPDYHLILGPDDRTDDTRGSLYLSNERFVGHVGVHLPWLLFLLLPLSSFLLPSSHPP